jgi:Zn-dependent protease
MFSSLRLGKFFGIDLFVHGTFWLLPLIVLFSGLSAGATLAEAGVEIVFIFAVFACVVLHELGHALAARAYGIGTRDITLYPIGGVASLERMPEKPGQEIAIALAGPAVNFVIAGALFTGLVGSAVVFPWAASASEAAPALVLAAKLLWANVFLGLFNLLPCFPMDGGRVLRAVLATRLSRLRATEIAAGVGTLMAGAFVVAGLYLPHFGLLLLAFVVWMLGQGELAAVRAQAAAREMRERFGEWYEPRPEGTPPVSPGFTGLVWDESRRVWIQYQDGTVVRVIDPD